MKTIAAITLCLISITCVHAVTLYRWTDAKGRVNYSEKVPQNRKANAVAIDIGDTEMTDAQKKAAADKLYNEQESLKTRPQSASVPPARTSSAAAAASPQRPLTACEATWKKFNDSQTCFAPYRYADGKIRPEDFQKCQKVTQPDSC
jgi:hypothetical protein